MANPKKMVVGFLFSEDSKKVLLIEKKTPAWQKGFCNGVGGKIEANESAIDAMRREFREETGMFVDKWHYYAQVRDFEQKWLVYFFWAVGTPEDARKVTAEKPIVVTVNKLPLSKIISNLRWLIPLALDPSRTHIEGIDYGVEG